MAKQQLTTVILTAPFANKEAGTKLELAPDLAQRLIDRSVAERFAEQDENGPVEETKIKTSKSKKK